MRKIINLLIILAILAAWISIPTKTVKADSCKTYVNTHEYSGIYRIYFSDSGENGVLSGDYYGWTLTITGNGSLFSVGDDQSNWHYYPTTISGSWSMTFDWHSASILPNFESQPTISDVTLCPPATPTATNTSGNTPTFTATVGTPQPSSTVGTPQATATPTQREYFKVTRPYNDIGVNYKGFDYTATQLCDDHTNCEVLGYKYAVSFSNNDEHTIDINNFGVDNWIANGNYNWMIFAGHPEITDPVKFPDEIWSGYYPYQYKNYLDEFGNLYPVTSEVGGDAYNRAFGFISVGNSGFISLSGEIIFYMSGIPSSEIIPDNYLQDAGFELWTGKNVFWWQDNPEDWPVKYPQWFLDEFGIPQDEAFYTWKRVNYYEQDGFFAFYTEYMNGAPKCERGYQVTDMNSGPVVQKFMWPGGQMNWKFSYRGDYKPFGMPPTFNRFGTASVTLHPLAGNDWDTVLIQNQEIISNQWVTVMGTINMSKNAYAVILDSGNGAIVEWDDTAISLNPISAECGVQLMPTATPTATETMTPDLTRSSTPDFTKTWEVTQTMGAPSEVPSNTPQPTLTATRTLQNSRTPFPSITPWPSLTPRPSSTRNNATATAWVISATAGAPTGTRTPSNTQVPGGTATVWAATGTFIPDLWNGTLTPNPSGIGVYTGDPNTDCERPSGWEMINISKWVDFERCSVLSFFTFGPSQQATAIAVPQQFGTYEPFGSAIELATAVKVVQATVAAQPWQQTGSSGTNNGLDPRQIFSGGSAPAGTSGNPWSANGAPFNFTVHQGQVIVGSAPGSGSQSEPKTLTIEGQNSSYNANEPATNLAEQMDATTANTVSTQYALYCNSRLNNLLSARLAEGACYALNFARVIGMLAWVQLFLNIVSILGIVHSVRMIYTTLAADKIVRLSEE